MTKVALFVKHKTQPGKRDQVRRVWERHMQSNIAGNPGHEAYFYCFDNNDPDAILAFQQYSDSAAAQSFLQTASYAAYLKEVEPLLAGPPELTFATPVWVKEGI
ncbi:MAG: antibiotic biosynthesis monooxygenase [Tepidisphaeraceae bacterium]